MTLGRHKCTTISNFAITNIIIITIFCDFILTTLLVIILNVAVIGKMIGIITKIIIAVILISQNTCQKILSCSKYDGNMLQIIIDLGKKK